MYGASPQAYDRAITVFSPDGRLFQVEYAKEAVKRGATSVGAVGKDSVVLAAVRNTPSKLVDVESLRKIYDVDKNIALSYSGLIADARRLVEITRDYIYREKFLYDTNGYVGSVANYIASVMHLYTQHGGVRPFGVSVLIGGVDKKGPQLYEIEPSGALTGFYADSIGEGKKEVDSYLEEHYRKGLSEKKLTSLLLKALRSFYGDELKEEKLSVAVISKEGIRYLEGGEIKKRLKEK